MLTNGSNFPIRVMVLLQDCLSIALTSAAESRGPSPMPGQVRLDGHEFRQFAHRLR